MRALVAEAVEARLSLAHLKLREILAPVHADFHQSEMSEAELDKLLQDSLDESRASRRSMPYLNLAVGARVNYLVSRDNDLLCLMQDPTFIVANPQLKIVAPADFSLLFEADNWAECRPG